MQFEVTVQMGEVFINGEFVAQLCWTADSVAMAVATWLESRMD